MFIVYDIDKNIKEFPQGVRPLDIFIHSIEKEFNRERIEGRSGYITKGRTHVNRPIDIDVGLFAYDTEDYRLLRDEVYSFFNDQHFFIAEKYQPGKIYKVAVSQSFIPERISLRLARASFRLDMVELPFAESIGTTGDIDQNGINYDDEMWSYGMGLLYEDEAQKYTHNTSAFKIYNAGNIPEHHPFEQRLKITIIGANKGYELKNVTTGDKFQLTKEVNGTIVLDGPNVTDNGLAALRKTNKQFITLKPGWNVFEQNQNATVSFDFPFYYL